MRAFFSVHSLGCSLCGNFPDFSSIDALARQFHFLASTASSTILQSTSRAIVFSSQQRKSFRRSDRPEDDKVQQSITGLGKPHGLAWVKPRAASMLPMGRSAELRVYTGAPLALSGKIKLSDDADDMVYDDCESHALCRSRRQRCGQSSQGRRGGYGALHAWLQIFPWQPIRKPSISIRKAGASSQILPTRMRSRSSHQQQGNHCTLEADQGRRQRAARVRSRASVVVRCVPHAGNTDCSRCRERQGSGKRVTSAERGRRSVLRSRTASRLSDQRRRRGGRVPGRCSQAPASARSAAHRSRSKDGVVCSIAEAALCRRAGRR
jgi:hypothetical protein